MDLGIPLGTTVISASVLRSKTSAVENLAMFANS